MLDEIEPELVQVLRADGIVEDVVGLARLAHDVFAQFALGER